MIIAKEVWSVSHFNIRASRNRTEKPELASYTMHTHDTYEIYCFWEGDADYFVEGTVYSLKSGDILLLKKAEAHSLMIRSLCPYERLTVHFNDAAILGQQREQLCAFLNERPLGQYNRYSASVFKNTNWIYYMNQICNSKNVAKRRLYLTILLWELMEEFPRVSHGDTAEKDSITEVISYINDHLTEKLSLEHICETFYMSKAQLNRRFKKATGSTVWEYIMTKRLVLAHGYLQNGEPPTMVCAKSGFNDYCSFYRAYKQKYGISPKVGQHREGKG